MTHRFLDYRDISEVIIELHSVSLAGFLVQIVVGNSRVISRKKIDELKEKKDTNKRNYVGS